MIHDQQRVELQIYLPTSRLFPTDLTKGFTADLIDEQDNNVLDDLDKVDEKLQGVSDEVSITATFLQDDHLGVPHDEAAEDSKAYPHVKL